MNLLDPSFRLKCRTLLELLMIGKSSFLLRMFVEVIAERGR